MPALEANCNKCGKKGHYAKACGQNVNNNRTVKRLTEEEMNEPDESTSDSDESIHHIKEIKKINEKSKHFTAVVQINGIKKEFIIDTGMPISIMPPDEKIMNSTKIRKTTIRRQDVYKKRSKNSGENSGKHRTRKQPAENGNDDKRKNRHNTTTRDGLDEEM